MHKHTHLFLLISHDNTHTHTSKLLCSQAGVFWWYNCSDQWGERRREGWMDEDGGRGECWHSQHANVARLHPPPPLLSSLCLSISHPLPFTGGKGWSERQRGKEGICNRIELCYLSPCLRFPPSTASTPVVVKTKHETEREGQFFHPFNNSRMISAYPLISSLLFFFLPSCYLFLPHSVMWGSLFLSPDLPFFHLVPVLYPFLLSGEGILLFWQPSLPSFLQRPSLLHQPKCIDGNTTIKIDFTHF